MTREQAVAEAERKQQSRADAKWIATPQGSEWAVARVGLPPSAIFPTGTATKPPPVAPHDEPQSSLERLTTLFGSAG